MATLEDIKSFEELEAAVKNTASFDKLDLTRLQEMQHLLLTKTPLSENKLFMQRWHRVNDALSNRISSLTSIPQWWERPIGIAFLLIVTGLVVAAIVYYLGWK